MKKSADVPRKSFGYLSGGCLVVRMTMGVVGKCSQHPEGEGEATSPSSENLSR